MPYPGTHQHSEKQGKQYMPQQQKPTALPEHIWRDDEAAYPYILIYCGACQTRPAPLQVVQNQYHQHTGNRGEQNIEDHYGLGSRLLTVKLIGIQHQEHDQKGVKNSPAAPFLWFPLTPSREVADTHALRYMRLAFFYLARQVVAGGPIGCPEAIRHSSTRTILHGLEQEPARLLFRLFRLG